MRITGFRAVLLALALPACAPSDEPVAKFDKITIEVPRETQAETAPKLSSVGADVPQSAARPDPKPAPKPTPPSQAKASKQTPPPTRVSRETSKPQVQPRPQAAATLTPEDSLLVPPPEHSPPARAAQSAMQESEAISPRMPNLHQMATCKGAAESDCKGLGHCTWVNGYTIGPGVYVDGYCEQR